MKHITLLIYFIVYTIVALGQNTADSWTQYLGWHYGDPPNWGGWVREAVVKQMGLALYDEMSQELDSSLLENTFERLNELDEHIDILQLDGGLGSARDSAKVADYMAFIASDSGLTWKHIVYNQSLKMMLLPSAQERMYWQIGNEISSPAYSGNLRKWQGEINPNSRDYDEFIIPYYVENYFAPTAEAIDSASKEAYGQKGLIKIALGSITNAGSQGARDFTEQLLNYEITGTYAPSLRGKKVYELIHLITVHYIMGNSRTESWREAISYFTNWIGEERIEGVWSTEEVGIKASEGNAGAAVGAVNTARYLTWAIENNFDANALRTNYYGWNTGTPGTRVTNFNDTLFNFLGHTPLQLIDITNTNITASVKLEAHSFANTEGSKSMIISYPERSANQDGSTVENFELSRSFWPSITSLKIYKYDTLGLTPLDYSIITSPEYSRVNFTTPVELDFKAGILLMIEGNYITSNNPLSNIKDKLSLVPNPCDHIAHLTFPCQWSILDLTGHPILKGYGSKINISALKAGYYFFESEGITKSFLVQR